ncbi:MAG: TonB-dependent receptor [Deltaproteobacteria bacterium]|nr:TonB-dependent receptor [Deltaproteobacteria bacterium]
MRKEELIEKIKLIMLITTLLLIIAPYAYAQDEDNKYHLKEIVVVGTKSPSSVQETPSSIGAFDMEMIEDAGINLIGDLAGYVPNINMVEFSERILSQPYFRGIGSGPNNPAVTTYLDGVPQLHGYSANIGIIDVDQAEFMRGAQGMLYGRNTVGGVIHILSRRPNLAKWEYSMEGEYGSYDLAQGKFRLSGPLVKEKLGVSLAAGYSSRDGYSDNDVTGNDIDSREDLYTKLQMEWLPSDDLSARFIMFYEQDRDGDYALHDLTSLRLNPFHGQRDYEGYLDRDIFAPTLILDYHGEKIDFASISGLVKWETDGATDLDYTPYPLMLRNSEMRNVQLSQEFQWRSAEDHSIMLNENMKLTWQAGILFFEQDYKETSVNDINNPKLPFMLRQTSPVARLEDKGIGAYAKTTLSAWDLWDMALGLRIDHEEKDADLSTFYTPALPGYDPVYLNSDRDFTELSPQVSIARHLTKGKMIYGSISRGYRAGGFNPASPPGKEDYDEETSWNYETGIKTSWLEDHLRVNMALFHIMWDHMQLNLPYGQTYFIDNAGDAESSGVELEFTARPLVNWDIFGSLGYNRTRFGSGSTSIRTGADGVNSEIGVGGNDLIYAPEFTANAGTRYSWHIRPDSTVFIQAEVTGTGEYFYNTANTESQGSCWIASIRAGYENSNWFAEVWAKNLFDKEYIPVAFEFPNGQSGFVGENGAPRTIGIRAGLNF